MIFISINNWNLGHAAWQAVDNGAVAAVVPDSYRGQPGVPALPFANPTEALGRLAAAFYNEPSQRMTVIGVTGDKP